MKHISQRVKMDMPMYAIYKFMCGIILAPVAIVLMVITSSVSHANQCAVPSEQELQQRDGVTINSVSLTAKKFLKSYMSSCADEERSADLYLLGVLDATEGKSWCDYRAFKSGSLREFIFEKLKKLDGDRLNERASKVIEDILSQAFPCGRKK
jgi:hypothetical protein